jgi:hypothetical protein
MYDEPGELLAKRSLVLEFCGGITKLEKTLGPGIRGGTPGLDLSYITRACVYEEAA